MNLLLMAGFLGSGKTTLIIRLVKALGRRDLKVAILVNEIGQVGVDNQLMRQLDLNVWELMGGCICCTLTAGLLTDLHRLDTDYQPDLVILEATGAAKPSEVLDALRYYQGRPLGSVTTAVVVDPLRLPKIVRVVGPLMEQQIGPADLLIMTKTDLATEEQVEASRLIAREINPRAALVYARAGRDGIEDDLLGGLVPWLN
jgi:G3E family GTPase